MREKTVEDKIKNWLKSNKIFYYKHVAGGGMVPGIADIICIVNGYYVGLEVKRPGGAIREVQIAMSKKVKRHGGVYVVIDNLEDAIATINAVKQNDLVLANSQGIDVDHM